MNQELLTLIGRLKDHSKGCEDKFLDLKTLQFEAKEGEMRLFNQHYNYYFKSDPKNPRDPKIIHAHKQFCRLCGVPHSFFVKNPEHMKNQMVSVWLPALKPEKATIMGKLRLTKDKEYIIRSLLPVEASNIPNYELLEMILEAIKDDFRLEFVIGDDRDDLILHVRFISKETFEICGEKCSTGFSVIASDLGAAPLSIETMLFRESSKTAMIASYSGESFFESNYEGIQPSALRELFPKLILCLRDQLNDLKERIESAKEQIEKKEDVTQLRMKLELYKGINKKFHILLFQELEQNTVANRWDFVNRMAILAKDFDVVSRVKIEKVAGELIDLCFEKS